MRLIAFLALIVLASCRRKFKYKSWRAVSQTFQNLRNSSEFSKIAKNPRMTVAQQKQAIRQLASKNGVLVEMEDYIESSDAWLREMKAKSKRISAELPKVLEEFWNVIEERSKTGVEKHYDLEKIRLRDPAVFEVVNFMADPKRQCSMSLRKIKAERRYDSTDAKSKYTSKWDNLYQRVRNISPFCPILSKTRDHRNRKIMGRGSSHGTSKFMGTSYYSLERLAYLP